MNPRTPTDITPADLSSAAGAPYAPLLLPELWVLLWSKSQNALHIEQVEDMLGSNRRAYTEDRRMDYVPLIFGSRALIDSAARSCRATIHARCDARRLEQSH